MKKTIMALCAAAAFLLNACGTSPPPKPPVVAPSLEATVTRTQYGVIHVTANDWGGLGFGQGYAAADDNLCVLAEAFMTFRGERSRYLGPDTPLPSNSTLPEASSLDSDFFFRHIVSAEAVQKFRDAQPPELRDLTSGYAAGFSRYVVEIARSEHSGRHMACRSAAWLAPISADDLYRRMIALNLVAGYVNFLPSIAKAAPPTNGASDPTADVRMPKPAEIGSNMIGFGSNATGHNQGLLFGNPHWFWEGVDRFEQIHLKIPHQIDVEGAAILGVPLVLIGFNHDVAWSHTVSTARRFTLYQLKLAGGDPTSYVYDGQIRHLRASQVTVDARRSDGTLESVTRTMYDSHFGPMLSAPWTGKEALTIRDVNAENTRAFRNWLRWDRASSLDEFMKIQQEEVAVPWVNTVAIGRNDRRAWYADIGAIPNVDDRKMADCRIGRSIRPALVTLDGSRSACEWASDPGSPQPGTLPPAQLPHLTRTDYVANMNDSYWMANPAAPLTGFAQIIGEEATTQSLRTRMGHLMIQQRLAGSDHLPGRLADSESIRTMVLNSRNLSAELFLPDVLRNLCPQHTLRASANGAPVDIQQACTTLQKWDQHGNPESIGAHIWDSFWERLESLPDSELYTVAFDPKYPVDTPRGLNIANPHIVAAFADGVQEIQSSPVELDAPREQYQHLSGPHGLSYPLAGGCGAVGYFTVVCAKIRPDGPALNAHGNSYMQVVTFTDEGVEPFTLLLPSQSTDPSSPHYRDYTAAYSRKQWIRAPFSDSEIQAGAIQTIHLQSHHNELRCLSAATDSEFGDAP